jgi:hypothetical protein
MKKHHRWKAAKPPTTIFVTTPWVKVQAPWLPEFEFVWRPAVKVDYPDIAWSDRSGHRIAEGTISSVVVTTDEATAAAIQANPKYQQAVTP